MIVYIYIVQTLSVHHISQHYHHSIHFVYTHTHITFIFSICAEMTLDRSSHTIIHALSQFVQILKRAGNFFNQSVLKRTRSRFGTILINKNSLYILFVRSKQLLHIIQSYVHIGILCLFYSKIQKYNEC